jgi:hypothetical protein
MLVLALAVTAAAQEIPFKIEKGYVLVEGTTKGDIPFEAAVSTGSTYSFYNEASLKKLHMIETSSSDTPGTVFTKDNALTLVYEPLTIAGQKPVEIRMLARHDAFDAMSRALGRKIDFILGADFFDGRVVQFEFRFRVLRFLNKPPVDEYKPGTSTLPDGGIRVVSKMTGNVQSMFGTMLTLPVSDEVTLDGNKAPSLLNTGVVMPVTARPNVARKSGSAPATVNVAFGEYQMTNVPVRVDDIKDQYDRSYTAIIGLGVLQNFTLTLDWKNKWIVIEK